MDKQNSERLIRVETKVDFIAKNMAYKSSISLLKWSMGGIGTVALAALLIASKVIL